VICVFVLVQPFFLRRLTMNRRPKWASYTLLGLLGRFGYALRKVYITCRFHGLMQFTSVDFVVSEWHSGVMYNRVCKIRESGPTHSHRLTSELSTPYLIITIMHIISKCVRFLIKAHWNCVDLWQSNVCLSTNS